MAGASWCAFVHQDLLELFLLGGRVIQLGSTTLRSLKLGFQPGYLLSLLRELALVALSISCLLGCAEITMSV